MTTRPGNYLTIDTPILHAPWALTPPYDTRDRSLFRQPDESAEQAHNRTAARKLAVLLEPLDGLPLSDYERRVLSWVACWETDTVAVLAALLRRTRADNCNQNRNQLD